MPIILTSLSKKRKRKAQTDEDLIATSLKRFKITADAESSWRTKGLEDLEFSIGTGQWDAAVKADREIAGKPCLTINRAPAFLRQYTGEERQHRPAMIVDPVGGGADKEVAKIHQGVLRHIEVTSMADVSYDNSYDMMMRIGSCPWRVLVDYVDERSFDQEPRIESIENPFAVYLSPVRRPDGTDPLWGHVIRDYQKDDYEAEFGKTSIAQLEFPTTQGAAAPEWVTKDGVRVAEYWWIELLREQLCLLDDGKTMLRSEMTDRLQEARIVDERDTVVRKVRCVKHNALEVIKEYTWLGRYLPFPEVNGVRLNVNGKIYRAGMVRDYRDAQRIYDFMVTRQVEQVDMVSKDPLWVPEENMQYGDAYQQMNRKNYSHLYFKSYDAQGRTLARPERAGREAPIAAMAEVIKQADYDMKAVVGIYGPSLGEDSGNAQESGFAIMNRQEQSETGAVAWHDNLNRAIVWQAKILVDLWPKYIDTAKLQRIINPDDSVRHAVVFNSQMGGDSFEAHQMLDEKLGQKKAYDVGVGQYDVTVSSGPMYKTARKEAFKAMTFVIGQNPEMMLPVFGDLWMKNADFADADLAADRFKKMLPPNLQDQDAEDLETKFQQSQAQIKQLTDQYNIVQQEMTRAADTIRTKRLDLESRERIALQNNWTQLMLQRLKSHDAAAQAQMDAQLGAITQRLQMLHDNMTIDQEAGAAPNTPELPGSVEPKVEPIVPAAPTPRPQPVQ